MGLVSLTAVTAFQSIGSILVIAFMIIPAMTASLWTKTMASRLLLSCLIGSFGSVAGIVGAIWLDTSLAGMMASVLGLLFVFSLYRSFDRPCSRFQKKKTAEIFLRTGNPSPASSLP